MVFLMDSTVQEAETFADICYKMQEQIIQDSKENNNLKELATYAQYFIRNFSAAGFFYIRKSLIFSLIEHAATYLIVAIQFNQRTS